jgi:LacI family transcriptional regulator
MPVTLQEIAAITGFCRATVDKVVHNRPGVREETRRRILQVMADLAYKPNIAGRALKMHKRKLTLMAVLLRTDSFTSIVDGIKEQLKNYESFGLAIDIQTVDFPDAESQAKILRECMDRDIVGLILTPLNDDRIADAVNRLVEKHIPVITVNNDLPGSARSCFVGQNLRQAGQVAARLVAKFIAGRGSVAVFIGSPDVLWDKLRLEGFAELLRDNYPDIAIVKIISAGEDPVRTYQETAKLLQEHPDIDAIYSTTGRAQEVARAVSALGFAGRITIVCFDLYDAIRDLVRQGVIDCAIGQDLRRQGSLPVQLFFQHLYYNEKLPQGELFTPIDIRIAENIDSPDAGW